MSSITNEDGLRKLYRSLNKDDEKDARLFMEVQNEILNKFLDPWFEYCEWAINNYDYDEEYVLEMLAHISRTLAGNILISQKRYNRKVFLEVLDGLEELKKKNDDENKK